MSGRAHTKRNEYTTHLLARRIGNAVATHVKYQVLAKTLLPLLQTSSTTTRPARGYRAF